MKHVQEVGPAVVFAARDVRPGHRGRGLSALPALVREGRGAASDDDDGMTARLRLALRGRAPCLHDPQRRTCRTSVRVEPGRRAVLAARRHLALPAARQRRPTAQPKACKIEFDLRYAFSSGALETVVSPVFDRIAEHLRRFLRASVRSRCMARADERAVRIEVVYCACSRGRAGRGARIELPAGATLIDALRASGVLQRHALASTALPGVGIWGRVQRARDAAARRRPGRDLPAAAGRPEGGAAPARPAPAASKAAASVAVRGDRCRGCAARLVGALLVVEDLALAVGVDAGDADRRCRASRSVLRARLAVLGLGGCDLGFFGLGLRGLIGSAFFRLASSSGRRSSARGARPRRAASGAEAA